MSGFPSLSMPVSHSEFGSIDFKGINYTFSWDTMLFNFTNDKGQFLPYRMYTFTTMQSLAILLAFQWSKKPGTEN